VKNLKVFLRQESNRGDARVAELIEGIRKSVIAGGGVVVHDSAPDALGVTIFRGPSDATMLESNQNLAIYLSPVLPPGEWYEALSSFNCVVVPSEAVAVLFREIFSQRKFSVIYAAMPLDIGALRGKNPPVAAWLDANSTDYRIYTVVPSHEVGVVYPLVREFLREYRMEDAVSLTIRAISRQGVEDAVGYAVDEVGIVKSRQPRVRLAFGPWGRDEQLALAHWGDCCLCPWAGCWFPIEAVYAMATGNFVAAPAWSAGSVLTPKSGVLINYTLDETGCAVIDWGQVGAVMRIAVANGRRERAPAKAAADEILCKSGHFFTNVMSKLALAPDCLGRGYSNAIIHRQPETGTD